MAVIPIRDWSLSERRFDNRGSVTGGCYRISNTADPCCTSLDWTGLRQGGGVGVPLSGVGFSGLGSLLVIALVNTALAYFVYFKMVATVGVTYISLVTFLISIIALMLCSGFLNESVTAKALAGMVIIALGLVAIDGRLSRPPSIPHRSR